MRKTFVCLACVCLVLSALVTSACSQPSTTTSAPAAPSTTTAQSTTAATPLSTKTPTAGQPTYGGTFTTYLTGSPLDWDEAFQPVWVSTGGRLVYEALLQGDWTKGPTGSGEVTFRQNPFPFPSFMTGCLAESWEIVDDQTMVFKIREGVRFHNKPPANGREIDADDIAYSLMRIAETPTSYNFKNYGLGQDVESIKALDKHTLQIKSMPGRLSRAYSGYVGTEGWTVPREAVQQYGNLRDWRNACGTGPFVVKDYVADSSISYSKNPNYWQKDPFRPGNTLPYVDSVKILIISDRSTLLAAVRTGKIDQMSDLVLEEKKDLQKTNSEMLWAKYLPNYITIGWRIDRKPFDDLRVRKALSVAVDRKDILGSLFEGDGELLQTVCMNAPEFARYFTPVDQLPPAAKENYQYSPEKAKELLKEAGYPNGFKTNIVCLSTEVDMLSILSSYWSRVGVDLELKVTESGVKTSVFNTKSYDQMITYGHNPNRPEMLIQFTWGQTMNFSMVNDPKINSAFVESAATLLTDPEGNARLVKDNIQYIIEQAYSFTPPTPYYYIGWQPWVKGYTGEITPGAWAHFTTFTKYLWVDENLKESMGY